MVRIPPAAAAGSALISLLFTVAGARAETDPAGREFWLAWPETTDLIADDPGFDADAEILIATDSTVPVAVSVSATGLAWSGVTARGAPARVRVPKTLKLESHEVVEDKGIRVWADDCGPVSVLFRVPATNASVGDDVYAALPVASLGREYYPDTYPGAAEFAVVATEDNTTVSWDNPHCPGLRSFNLARGQAIQHECPLDRTNLATRGIAGTRVSADRPVAVFGGSAGSNIIHTFITVPLPAEIKWDFADVLLEAMRPVDDWEREYRTVPFAATSVSFPGDFVRIIAACAGTTVEVIDSARTRTQTLDQGGVWDLIEYNVANRTFRLSQEPLIIRASAPIQVSQYSIGNVAAGVGDPSQLTVPGLGRGSTTALAYVPERYDAHLSVVLPTTATGSFLLDGTPPLASWTPYPDGIWSWTRIDRLTPGEHRLSASAPMAAAVQASSLTAAGDPYEGAMAYPVPGGTASDARSARIATDDVCALACTGACLTLDAGPGWVSHLWSTGETTPSISFCPTRPSERVTVELSDRAGCSARGEREVRALDGPAADAGADRELCTTAPVAIGGSPTASLGLPPYLYLWTPPADLDDPTLANPTATPTVTRTWTVTVTDSQGCTATDTVSIALAPPAAPGDLGNTLLAARAGGDVASQWAADPAAAEYRWKQDSDKRLAALATVLSTPLTAERLVGAVPAPPPIAFYRVVAANCAGSEGP